MVTGAAGYIGGQTVLKLLDAGHEVLGIDRNPPPESMVMLPNSWWSVNDFASDIGLSAIDQWRPEAIIHCAGTSLVGPSMTDPEDYYSNNFVRTKRLLDFLVVNNMINVRVIFSSSAATYGEPKSVPCVETDVTDPISPYGQSKLMIEWMLNSYQRAYGLDYVSFRYFNACGADSLARHGQVAGATHIIARVLEAVKNSQDFTLYGDNYPTPDGTCIRDYIHVEDLADAHVRALDRTIPSDIYNLGTNCGYSNLEVVRTAAQITGVDIPMLHGPKREGDPAVLTADATKFMSTSGWQPKFNMTDIVNHVWAWYNK
jgi:UDP-glucose-4-epimerase GalE